MSAGMSLRRPALWVSVMIAIALALGVAPITSASTIPAFLSLSASTPGHVTGTVTTDSAYVRLTLRYSGIGYDTETHPAGPGSVVAFDLPAWGMSQVEVAAKACESATTCTGPTTISGVLTPLKVVPDVSISDALLGPDEPTVAVTVEDPDGGGVLRATWANQEHYAVARTGITELPLRDEGARNLVIERCHDNSSAACNTRVVIEMVVNRQATGTPVPGGAVRNDHDPGTVDGYVPIIDLDPLPAGTEVTVNWGLADVDSGGVKDDLITATLPVLDDGTVLLPIDVTPYSPGLFVVDGTISYFDPSVGAVLTGNLTGWNDLIVVNHFYDVTTVNRQVKASRFTKKRSGRCARVTSPARPSWKGSVRLASNATCTGRTWRTSGAMVTFRSTLPASDHARMVTITALGRKVPGSRGREAFLQVQPPGTSTWRSSRLSGVGTTVQIRTRGDQLRVTWRVKVSRGFRYDLKGFRLSIEDYTISD